MSEALSRERLPCGEELGILADQVAERLLPADPEHQASCPHCQAALRQLEQLWGTVRDVAGEQIAPPARLIEVVVRKVRRQLRALGQRIPAEAFEAVVPRLVAHAVLASPRGATRIADAVVARLVARVVRESPGVQALSGASDLLGASQSGRVASRGVAVEVSGHRVVIDIRLVAEYGKPIPALSDEVRRRVIAFVKRITGLEPVSVNIVVDDVYGDPAPAPRRVRLPAELE